MKFMPKRTPCIKLDRDPNDFIQRRVRPSYARDEAARCPHRDENRSAPMKSAGERPYILRLNGAFGGTDEMSGTTPPKVVMPYRDGLIVLDHGKKWRRTGAVKDRA